MACKSILEMTDYCGGLLILFMHSHVDLKGNLIKAMMVMNWLNMLEVETF